MHWFIDPIRNHYADFSGRAPRKEYWMFMLMYMLLTFIAGVLIVAAALQPFLNEWSLIVLVVLFMIGMLALIVPSIAIQVRRLHDIGYSGWWYFIGFIPYIGGIIILVMSALRSEIGTNKYGPNPYGVGNEVVTPQPSEPAIATEQKGE